MADISSITLPDGNVYNFKDPESRQKIPWCVVDSTSTATVYTATVPEITKLESGVSFICMNNVVTSASGCTMNVNNLGAKPIYATSAAASRVTTGFAIDVTWMFVYNEERVDGGCWDMVHLYNTNTTYTSFANLNHGNANFLAKSTIYRYQLLFQIDDVYVTPLNNVSNDRGTSKTMLTNVEFDPFGEIFYQYTTTSVAKDARLTATSPQYAMSGFDLRYTFNCGQTLTAYKPLYLKVALQSNGMVKIANSTPWAQDLPSTADGLYYIYLGRTYSTYQAALHPFHPIYYHDGTGIRIYENPKIRNSSYYTKAEIDATLGDVETLLAAI